MTDTIVAAGGAAAARAAGALVLAAGLPAAPGPELRPAVAVLARSADRRVAVAAHLALLLLDRVPVSRQHLDDVVAPVRDDVPLPPGTGAAEAVRLLAASVAAEPAPTAAA